MSDAIKEPPLTVKTLGSLFVLAMAAVHERVRYAELADGRTPELPQLGERVAPFRHKLWSPDRDICVIVCRIGVYVFRPFAQYETRTLDSAQGPNCENGSMAF